MENADIAKELIGQTADMSALLISLSLAICGGIVAAFLQIAFHDADGKSARITVMFRSSLFIAFILESLSVFFGYATKGSIITNLPFYIGVSIDNTKRLGEQTGMKFIETTQWFSLLQFLFMISGVLFIFAFIFINRQLIVVSGTSTSKGRRT